MLTSTTYINIAVCKLRLLAVAYLPIVYIAVVYHKTFGNFLGYLLEEHVKEMFNAVFCVLHTLALSVYAYFP